MALGGKSGLDAFLNRPEQESAWRRFWKSPAKFIAQRLYNYVSHEASTSANDSASIRIVCISDTHNTQPQLPDGDVLIHAGDLTQSGTPQELNSQIEWLDRQPHRYKLVIAGNHELCLDPRFLQGTCKDPPKISFEDENITPENSVDWKSLHYLHNSWTTLHFDGSRHLKVFGSPYTPKHGNWAFQYERTNPNIWEDINVPNDIDILITHGPPRSHLDLGQGCRFLLSRLRSIEKKPLLHVFGHIHGAYGKEILLWDSFQRAYEHIMDDDDVKWLNLAKLGYYGVIHSLAGSTHITGQRTIMVNAAAVGGVRDEKRREAICVDL